LECCNSVTALLLKSTLAICFTLSSVNSTKYSLARVQAEPQSLRQASALQISQIAKAIFPFSS